MNLEICRLRSLKAVRMKRAYDAQSFLLLRSDLFVDEMFLLAGPFTVDYSIERPTDEDRLPIHRRAALTLSSPNSYRRDRKRKIIFAIAFAYVLEVSIIENVLDTQSSS